MAGLTAARILADHGLPARILDKGRVPGGRISTRTSGRTSGDAWSMDHGAPFFTARDPEFRREVEGWAKAGVVAPWAGRIGYVRRGGEVEPATESTRWVGVPGMRDVPLHLARTLDVGTGIEVSPIVPAAGRWLVGGDAYDRVLVTAPPAQAAALLGAAHPGFAARLEGLEMQPCWALMLRLGRRGAGGILSWDALPWDGLFFEDDPVFRWVARDSSKPGRAVGETAGQWVLHAAPAWSAEQLERDPEWVAAALSREFSNLVRRTGGSAGDAGDTEGWTIESARAHRWRYAAPESEPTPGLCLWDSETGIGVAGDALGGGRVEGAFLSGAALARAVLGRAAQAQADPATKGAVSTGAGSLPR
ncbi:hypothetical protein BH23GEM11_BH23GEM11_01340 [soil metagenome]